MVSLKLQIDISSDIKKIQALEEIVNKLSELQQKGVRPTMIHSFLQYAGIAATSTLLGSVIGYASAALTLTFGSAITVPLCLIGTVLSLVGATEYANSRSK